jgi:tight adherence protein C
MEGDSDILGSLLTLLSVLLFFGFIFFLAYGLWQLTLKRLYSEAKEMEERKLHKAMRKVFLRHIGFFNRRFLWPKYEKRVTKRIVNAGGLDGLVPEEFMALQELSCVLFLVIGLLVTNFLRNDLNVEIGYWLVLAFGAFGLFYPEIWLRDQVKKRHWKIIRELPYNMDLLTLSVEAGLDFQAAVGTVVQKGRKGPLVEEMDLMLKHLRMGKTREEALRMLGERVSLPQLNSFIAALIQADKMGTSLGKVLRIQATQMRVERTQRAEKLANEAPVKMLFPLIACIFPTVFMILFGPIVFRIIMGEF